MKKVYDDVIDLVKVLEGTYGRVRDTTIRKDDDDTLVVAFITDRYVIKFFDSLTEREVVLKHLQDIHNMFGVPFKICEQGLHKRYNFVVYTRS